MQLAVTSGVYFHVPNIAAACLYCTS